MPIRETTLGRFFLILVAMTVWAWREKARGIPVEMPEQERVEDKAWTADPAARASHAGPRTADAGMRLGRASRMGGSPANPPRAAPNGMPSTD